MFKRIVIKLKMIVNYLTTFHILANIRMPRYSEKHYAQKDAQELFFMKLVETGWFTQEALKWLFVHESLKEQRYLYPRISIPKSTWATNVLPLLSDT